MQGRVLEPSQLEPILTFINKSRPDLDPRSKRWRERLSLQDLPQTGKLMATLSAMVLSYAVNLDLHQFKTKI